MTKTLTAAVLTVLALTLSACGSNDDAKAAKSLSESIMKQQKSAGSTPQLFSVKQKDADCIGNGMVKKIGTDQLKQYGILDKDLKAKKQVNGVKMSAGDATSATDVFFGCTDILSMVRSAIAKSGTVPARMRTCVDKSLTEATIRPYFVSTFQGKSSQAQRNLTAPMSKCALGSGG